MADVLLLSAPTKTDLLDAIEKGSSDVDGPWRLAVFDPTPQRLEIARKAVEAGRPRHGRDGIFFSSGGLLQQDGKLAFLFPGIEANFSPVMDDVARHFGLQMPQFQAEDLQSQGLNVFQLNRFLNRVMKEVGIQPDHIAGHSIGEWSGMYVSGVFEDEWLENFVGAFQPGSFRIEDQTYVAIGAGVDRVHGMISDLDRIEVTHDNCPHQSIVCGPGSHVEPLLLRLREQRILHEVLPFKSGFHSSALAGHLDFYEQSLRKITLQRPALPLWSATTCSTYPNDSAAMADLFLEHLVKPVRFRELILKLYDEGVRVFVQVGQGSLAAFVDDCLTGKAHNAISLTAPQRPGMQQVQWACADLYVEGAPVNLEKVGLTASQPRVQEPIPVAISTSKSSTGVIPPKVDDIVLLQFQQNLQEIIAAQNDVVNAFAASPAITTAGPLASRPRPTQTATANSAPSTLPDQKRIEHIVLSLETYPELIDHSLFPIHKNWPNNEDRGPAVPMTMSMKLMLEAAQRFDPTRVPIAIEDAIANTWLYVEPAVDVEVTTTRVDSERLHVKIGPYTEGTVVMADRFPEPPQPWQPPAGGQPAPMSAEAVYRDGWLFHGPRYQGISAITDLGPDWITGVLESLPAKGCLLDAAGQLYGFWIAYTNENDRIGFPIRIKRTEFFSADPDDHALLDCTTWIRFQGRYEIRADLEMTLNGRLYCRITDWADWRFATGGGLFGFLRQPQKNLLASAHPAGFLMLLDHNWTPASLDFLTHRFLSSAEIKAMGGIRQAQRQIDWLKGRVVAKDAIRKLLFEKGYGPTYPIEISIESEPSGRPVTRGPYAEDIRVSIAHKPGFAVAIAAEGVDPGIDVEKIEPRSDAFADLAFVREEVALLPAGNRDEWLTRFWCVKEAAGKARGDGLAGNPKGITINKVEGERLLVDGRWLQTLKVGDYIVAWTVA